MTTARLSFFAMPSEFSGLMNAWTRGLDLVLLVVGASIGENAVGITSFKSLSQDGRPSGSLRLARQWNKNHGLTASRRELFKTVALTQPSLVGNVLYLSELSAKSDWWNPDERTVEEVKEGVNLLRLLKRNSAKSWADCGITAQAIGRPQSERQYSHIKCTPAAKNFFQAGGMLRQAGVSNVEFRIRPRAS